MSGRRTFLFAVIAVACALGLAACGGGSGSGTQSSTTTTGGSTGAGNNATGDPVVSKAFESYSGEKDATCVTSGVTNLSNNKPVYLCTGQEPGGSPVPCAPMVWDGKNVSKPDVNGAFDTGNGTFSC
ncbi:MAG TPA: hypothetical protein VG652_11710 [Gaiellaceae bacterium]|nr:hypothetical protein [Gaiellaceae bacterium]